MTAQPIIFFDSSTLIAALIDKHPFHDWANSQLLAAELKNQVGLSTHSIAEVFKVLTVHPKHALPVGEAKRLLRQTTKPYSKVLLDDTDYFAALERCNAQHLSGSVIFDALIAQAALKAGAGSLMTLNAKDFLRLGEDIAALVVSP